MKKIFIMLFTALAVFTSATAQKGKPVNTMYMPVDLINDDGTKDTYIIKKGDQLVYHVNAGGNEYDFIVTVNDGGVDKAIDFNYAMTNAAKTSGHVNISINARKTARHYVNYFRGGDLNLTDASTVWLTNANFGELDYSKTKMSFDGGDEETLYTHGNNDVQPVVKIKGVDKKIEAFSMTNAESGSGDKTLWINNSNLNPLIIKMELGFTIELKEIR